MISCIFYFLNIRVVVNVNYSGLSRPNDEFLFPGQKSIQKCPLQPCFAYHLQIKTVSEIFSDLNRKRLLNSPARKHFLQSLNK